MRKEQGNDNSVGYDYNQTNTIKTYCFRHQNILQYRRQVENM